jgi:membrane fusion protein, multidrug efflux system
MKAPNLKDISKKIKGYDYKGMIDKAKKFNFKSPDAYKKLFKDKVFLQRLIGVIVFILLFNTIKGCMFKPAEKLPPPRPVETGLVIQKDVPIYLESFGTLTALEEVGIKAQATGRIQEVHFSDGDYIEQGDLLYTIDPGEYEAQARKAQASLSQSLADLKLKTAILERNKMLAEKDLISKQDYESLQTDLAAAQAKVDLDKAALDLANINLGYCYILAPFNGITSKGQLDRGNIVIADEGPELVNIKNIDTLFVDFTLSEKELQRVRQAMKEGSLTVEIIPGALQDAYEGMLVFIDNAVDNMTGTISARAAVTNKDMALWAGQFVRVRLILQTAKDAVLAPYAGVKIGQKGHYLFVVTDEKKADLRQIKVDIRQGEYIMVTEGVSPGEKVVITGMLGLYPGAPVIGIKEGLRQEKKDNKKK